MFKIEQIFIVSLGWARGLFLFCTELFGKNKGISRFHLTYLDGLFFRRKAVAMAKVGGPPRPKFSQTNLLKSKWDKHFRGVKVNTNSMCQRSSFAFDPASSFSFVPLGSFPLFFPIIIEKKLTNF